MANRAASLNSANLSANLKKGGTFQNFSEEPDFRVPRSHFGQVALGREAEAIDRVGPAVGPLAELVGGLGEGHVGGNSAVDDGLWREKTGLK